MPLQASQAQKQSMTSMNTQQLETGWLLNLIRNIATAGQQQQAPAQAGQIPAPPPGSPAANFLQVMQGGGVMAQPGQVQQGAPNAQNGTVQPGNPAPQSGVQPQQNPQQPAPQSEQKQGGGKERSAVQNMTAGAEGDGAANAFMKALQFIFTGGG